MNVAKFPIDGNKNIYIPESIHEKFGPSTKQFIARAKAEPLFRAVCRDLFKLKQFNNTHFGIIDIGAWKSDNAIPWAANYANSQIYAIDPSATNIAFGQYLAFFNKLHNVNHIQAIASRRVGEIVEVGQGTIEHAKFKKSGDQKIISEEKIYTSTIDLLIPQQAKKTIRFFHIDVEGFEMDVLAGSEMTINAAQPFIAFEQHLLLDHAQLQQILCFLGSKGYTMYMLNEVTGGRADCRNFIAVPSGESIEGILAIDYSAIIGSEKERIFDGPALVQVQQKNHQEWIIPMTQADEDYALNAITEFNFRHHDKSKQIILEGLKQYPDHPQLNIYLEKLNQI